jgi:hypothetical protein
VNECLRTRDLGYDITLNYLLLLFFKTQTYIYKKKFNNSINIINTFFFISYAGCALDCDFIDNKYNFKPNRRT